VQPHRLTAGGGCPRRQCSLSEAAGTSCRSMVNSTPARRTNPNNKQHQKKHASLHVTGQKPFALRALYPLKYRYAPKMADKITAEAATSRQFQLVLVTRRSSSVAVPKVKLWICA
jgi:hypothetical protein